MATQRTGRSGQATARMAATSLKLPGELKQRIDRLAAGEGLSPHAFMVGALAREAERREVRERFAAEAAAAEAEALASGRAHTLRQAFDYLAKRAAGEKAGRPRPRAWRSSR